MIPDISLAMDYVRELHPRDLKALIERIEKLVADTNEYKFGKTQITIDSNRNRIWIESSDYGHYTYAWGSPGESFTCFLAGLNKSYVLNKLNIKEVFDKRASFSSIRKAIKEAIPYYKEIDFQKQLRNMIAHIESICETSNEFCDGLTELNSGWRQQWSFLDDDSYRDELECIFSEPWNFICTKESTTARKLWKDFQKLQEAIRKEVVVA